MVKYENTMGNSLERSIRQAIEKTPLTHKPAQDWFAEWCKINLESRVDFIPRQQWERLGEQEIWIQNEQNIYTLYLPKDLHLGEMGRIINALNRDTRAGNTANSVRTIQELGEIFEKAGLYLWQYAPCIEDGKGRQIAQEMAHALYEYGLALQHKEKKEAQLPQEVALSQEDKQKLDEWFLGRKAYQTRLRRLGENPSEEQEERVRKKLFKNHFKALARQGYQANSEQVGKTQKGPIQHIQDITIRNIIRAIETPRREMETSIFIRGGRDWSGR